MPKPAPPVIPAPPSPPNPHMSDAAFEAAGRDVLAHITAYWQRLRAADPALPVAPRVAPGQFAARLPTRAPEAAEPFDRILADAGALLPDALTHWQHPSYFAYFPANISPPAVLADLLAAGLGQNGFLWSTSPAATELETRMLDWMAGALTLPAAFLSTSPNGGGVIQGTASEAALVALVAARHRARAAGRTGAPVVYTSTQAHSSVVKAALITGLIDAPPGTGQSAAWGHHGSLIRLIPTDDHGRMNTAALADAMHEDHAAGRVPLFICATVGTTASCAADDLTAIGPLARHHHAWLHVDSAFAASACICAEHRALLTGIEHADSFSTNPHKWLLTNFDCGLMWTRDRRALTASLNVSPEYLKNPASDAGAVWDYRDWQVPLGRRFRALKLWFVLRAYGLEGLRAFIREHVRIAALFESLVAADPRFHLPVPRGCGLTLICFNLREPNGDDRRSRELLARLNASGRIALSHAMLPPAAGSAHPRYVLRMAIGGTFTQEQHVREAWSLIQATAAALPA
ncbi:MAG: pyridoxal-dependent decarboxylase [Phycisphaerales bacterium]